MKDSFHSDEVSEGAEEFSAAPVTAVSETEPSSLDAEGGLVRGLTAKLN